MNRHTKGPWQAERFCVWSEDKYVAATQTGINEEEQQANAKLIAAAPDLLEACKAVLDIVNAYSHIPAQLKACEILQEAIAKAGIGR